MTIEIYGIRYEADTDAAKGKILSLREALAGSDEDARRLGAAMRSLSSSGNGMSKALDGVADRRKGVQATADAVEFLAGMAHDSQAELIGMAAALDGLRGKEKLLTPLSYAINTTDRAAGRAKGNVSELASALEGVTGRQKGVEGTADAVTSIQRHAYGATKNIEELNAELGKVGAVSGTTLNAATNLNTLNTSSGLSSKGLMETSGSADKLNSSLVNFAARVLVFHQLKAAVMDLGKALGDARETADKGGDKNVNTRDKYRELANLQGHAEPDNAVVAGALRFRMKTGLGDDDANDALRRFEGGLPAAKEKGNITGDATSGIAGDFLSEAARTGLRVDVKGGTSGLLASKIAQTSPVKSVDQGVGKFATILDTLNRGDGDLDPLVQSLVRGSGGMVGASSPFKSLETAAAAQSVASLNASPTVSMTRVRQASTGLNRLMGGADGAKMTKEMVSGMSEDELQDFVMENHGEAVAREFAGKGTKAKRNWVEKQIDKDAVPSANLGLKVGDFAGNIEKLSPLLEGKENMDAELEKAGLKNQAERRSLIQFYQNKDILKKETDTVTKGADVADVKAKNTTFFAGDTAQRRIADATNDAADFALHTKDEKLQIGRTQAEASLKKNLQLDTASSNFDEKLMDSFPARILTSLSSAVGLTKGPTDGSTLPLSMGGKSTRQLKIDATAMDRLSGEAQKVGVNPPEFFSKTFGKGDASFEERYSALASEVQKKGGNAFGTNGDVDAQLRQLVRETQNTNELLRAAQEKQKENFLPGVNQQPNPN